MVSESDLLRLARQAIRHVVNTEGIPGILGKADGTIRYIDPSGDVHYNRMWARVNDFDSITEIVVRAPTVPPLFNLPVIIAERDGIPTVIRVDYQRAAELTGGRFTSVAEHAWAHGRFGPDALYVTGPQFIPLMAHPASPPDMTVVVERAFYRYVGIEKVWVTAASGDLSGYVPEAAEQTEWGMVNHHFLALCLDRASNLLAIVDGYTRAFGSSSPPFSEEDVMTLTIPDGYWPICAIRFYQGQTAIEANDIFMDLRLWGGEYHSPASFSGEAEDVFDIYNQIITLDDQDANTLFAGPLTGSPDKPAFRLMDNEDLPDLLALKDPLPILYISSNAITVTKTYHRLAAESGTTDALDTISSSSLRSIVFLQASFGHEITVLHGENNIFLNGGTDFVLTDETVLMLVKGYTGEWSDVAAPGAGTDYDDAVIGFTIHGGGEAITTGLKGYLPIPRTGTITKWQVVADQVGSIVVDIWKDTYTNFPPTIADTITGTDLPTLTGAQKNESSALTGWTTSLSAEDWLAFNVNSVATVTIAVVVLYVTFEG